MEEQVLGLRISYSKQGEGEPLILLHGWGQNKKTFHNVIRQMSEDYTVYALDLPGFGQSEMILPMNLDDYVRILRQFVQAHELEHIHLLGHSFGGRIAIRYASLYPVEKLILVDSAGIRTRLSIWKKVKIFFYKFCKKLGIKLTMGSTDYRNATPMLKQTMNLIIHQDLTPELQTISCPTLLIWGADDVVTPLSQGQRMHELIRNSGFIVVPKCGHFPYLERFRYFILVLSSFLKGDGS